MALHPAPPGVTATTSHPTDGTSRQRPAALASRIMPAGAVERQYVLGPACCPSPRRQLTPPKQVALGAEANPATDMTLDCQTTPSASNTDVARFGMRGAER